MLERTTRICTDLSTVILILCTSCQCLHFSLLRDERVASGATTLRTITKTDMTPIFCATLCGSDCGMFHLSNATNECSVFQEKDYDTGVVLTPDPAWIVGYRKQHTTVTQGEWTLAFRAQKSIGVSVWDTWSNVGKHDDNPVPTDFPFACLRLEDYGSCDRHFRSHILDKWENIKEVRFSLVKSDIEVAYILFNGTGTTRDSWFSQNTILASTWVPSILNEAFFTDPGVQGFESPPVSLRRFYFFGPHNGCEFDWFYTMTIDQATDNCITGGIWHMTIHSFPTFLYSTTDERASLLNGQIQPIGDSADALAVWVKYN